MVLGILKNRAGSEHLGWARSQGSNFGLRAGGVLQIEALQEVLKKLKSKRIPLYEKKYGQVPMVRLWNRLLPMFSQEEIYHLESYTRLLPRMWLSNSGKEFAEFYEVPFVFIASPCCWSLRADPLFQRSEQYMPRTSPRVWVERSVSRR